MPRLPCFHSKLPATLPLQNSPLFLLPNFLKRIPSKSGDNCISPGVTWPTVASSRCLGKTFKKQGKCKIFPWATFQPSIVKEIFGQEAAPAFVFPVFFLLCFELSCVFYSFTSLLPSRKPKVMTSLVEEHEQELFVLTVLPGDYSVFFLVLVL